MEPGFEVLLEDKLTKQLHYRGDGDYNFNHRAANAAGRFVLHYTKQGGAAGIGQIGRTTVLVSSKSFSAIIL